MVSSKIPGDERDVNIAVFVRRAQRARAVEKRRVEADAGFLNGTHKATRGLQGLFLVWIGVWHLR